MNFKQFKETYLKDIGRDLTTEEKTWLEKFEPLIEFSDYLSKKHGMEDADIDDMFEDIFELSLEKSQDLISSLDVDLGEDAQIELVCNNAAKDVESYATEMGYQNDNLKASVLFVLNITFNT